MEEVRLGVLGGPPDVSLRSPGGRQTSLRGSDPCAPDRDETKTFVERGGGGREGGWREGEGGRESAQGEGGGGSLVSSQGPGRPARSIASIKP